MGYYSLILLYQKIPGSFSQELFNILFKFKPLFEAKFLRNIFKLLFLAKYKNNRKEQTDKFKRDPKLA